MISISAKDGRISTPSNFCSILSTGQRNTGRQQKQLLQKKKNHQGAEPQREHNARPGAIAGVSNHIRQKEDCYTQRAKGCCTLVDTLHTNAIVQIRYPAGKVIGIDPFENTESNMRQGHTC
jgi:hypothetical protein